MLKNLLLYRFGILNGMMAALLGYLIVQGYAARALAADPTGIVLAIGFLFVCLWASTATNVWKTARGLNALKNGRIRGMKKKASKRLAKIEHIHDGSAWLAYLGLIGTVVGFIVSMQGVDLGALSTAQGVQAMVPKLVAGMGIALYTTLAGSFFGIWTEFNYRMLHTATACLVVDESDE